MFAGGRTPSARSLLLNGPLSAHQEELESSFFSSFRLKNKTLKLTAPHRLDDLNILIAKHLSGRRPLQAMDIGISSGITTLEWFESLQRDRISCRMVAGDLTAHAMLWSVGAAFHILAEENGHPLQYEIAGLTFAHAPRLREKLLFFPLVAFSTSVMRRLAMKFGNREKTGGIITSQRVALVSPRLTAQASIEVIDDDLFEPWVRSERFDVIRVANVLNRAYFSTNALTDGIRLLRSRLNPQGLLALCRTEGPRDSAGNHATLFRLEQDGRLIAIDRLGRGSEIEHLAIT